MAEPVTKSDLAGVLADMVVAMRDIQIALLGVQIDDREVLKRQIDEIGKRADAMWTRYKAMTGQDDD
ncbi:hypothetical protein AB433_07435 [Croceicoccus naphthovorans]|uniref:Uncharacterized protein n=2 Tax=Croceicoccus naphthovorans TaxID=1348774 RepID=A0A0G3XF68_9SPHN|nr:hypothetical protein AB433_07435 [Croceicoccus naphthovorans]